MTFKTLKSGQKVNFVHRETMRRRQPCRSLTVPYHLRAVYAALPTPPASIDFTKGGTLQFPMMGNDQYGDCYEADVAHRIGMLTGNVGTEVVFTDQQVLAAYAAITGFNPSTGANDNGTSTDQIMGYWKNPGFAGGHKVLDEMAVNPLDPVAMSIAQANFCAVGITLAVPDAWVNEAAPGFVWDAGAGITADQNNGHAVALGGYDPGKRKVLTWGFSGEITEAGLGICDAEATVGFSLDWFNAQGVAPDGQTYAQKASLWVQLGGNTLPPSPFPGPGPQPIPTPPQPTPPAPTSFQEEVDQWFVSLEAAMVRRPDWVRALKLAQPYVDVAIQEWANYYGIYVGFTKAAHAYPHYANIYRALEIMFVRLPV